MSEGIERFRNLLYLYKAEFIKNSFFYRLSLNRRSDIFDTSKFIPDPWEGNPDSGKNILNGEFYSLLLNHPIDILNIFSQKKWKESKFISDFFWLRDIQAIGGNSGRKYAQNLISAFISSYKKTRKFWKYDEIWNCATLGERIVNWILSYTFFASGSSDNFQKTLLSSIDEQLSHLLKCYKAEFNPYSKLMALKGIVFCYCVMKFRHKKKIFLLINEICELIDNANNSFLKMSPKDYFHIFRSLLEIRFIVKINNINLPDLFLTTLSKMAANIRALRLGNGELSMHPRNSNENMLFIPSSRIIDTALSIVDIKDNASLDLGFDRLATKKSTLIINTKTYNMKSIFNPLKEPGINIFEFEASFGMNKLLHRSDISVLYNNHRIKLGKNSQNFSKREIKNNTLLFEGESQFFNNFFKFAFKRELKCFSNFSKLEGRELIFLSKPNTEFFVRFVFNENAELCQTDERGVLVIFSQTAYDFKYIFNDKLSLKIRKLKFPTVEITAISDGKNEIECNWTIEERE